MPQDTSEKQNLTKVTFSQSRFVDWGKAGMGASGLADSPLSNLTSPQNETEMPQDTSEIQNLTKVTFSHSRFVDWGKDGMGASGWQISCQDYDGNKSLPGRGLDICSDKANAAGTIILITILSLTGDFFSRRGNSRFFFPMINKHIQGYFLCKIRIRPRKNQSNYQEYEKTYFYPPIHA